MMDDSLADVQQEKRMPVKELEFDYLNKKIRIETLGRGIEIIFGDEEYWIVLDCNQAHLLKLYLEEHLK